MDKALQIFTDVYFNSTKPHLVAFSILYIIGQWKMLTKSGVKGFWSLVPCAREYQFARCANRESDGRAASVLDLCTMACVALSYVFKDPYILIFIVVLVISLDIALFMVHIRIYGGIIDVYNAKRSWMILWLFLPTRVIPALVWGYSKAYQPRMKADDIRAALDRILSSENAEVMDTGLTVNLKQRAVWDFFHKKPLLQDIHMYIPQGHMVLLLGGSGVGKTTFVNAINGYEKGDAEIILNGRNIYKDYRHMLYECGYVPQQELMRSKDTVYHTLADAALMRLPVDTPPKVRKERIEEVMDILGLTPARNTLVQRMSGGQKKRLSIAMELISNPSLFILDEPDSGLDGVMAKELMEELRHVADTGKIVIVITHTPDRVIDCFDDVIVLAKDSTRTGRLAFYGSVDDARKFFECDKMEQIIKKINTTAEGGEGLADSFIERYPEVKNAG
ncbi:MAG: ABC transporter ATP-binding protein [Lachnospiraceae bacterium]|nr:ABC transporter ATP-binding protein [Lachnospiraceae bacterium]